MENKKRISKKDGWGATLRWLYLSHSCYNYDRYQGLGFCGAVGYALRKIYPDKEKMGKELEKHTKFFNTESFVGSIILGIVLAMEEEKANGGEVTDDAIVSIKAGLMGPCAGIGDTLVQGIIIPILLAIAISLSSDGSVTGVIFYVVAVSTILLGIAYVCYMSGYKLGTDVFDKLVNSGKMQVLLAAAGIMGCMVLGGLVSNYVNITTPLAFSSEAGTYSLQDNLLNAIFPGLLSLLGTLGVYRALNKGVSTLKLLGILFVLGSILGTFGIIG